MIKITRIHSRIDIGNYMMIKACNKCDYFHTCMIDYTCPSCGEQMAWIVGRVQEEITYKTYLGIFKKIIGIKKIFVKKDSYTKDMFEGN